MKKFFILSRALVIWAIGIALLVLIASMCSCTSKSGHLESYIPNSNSFTMTYKYKIGDVVYLKPDSTKGLITKINTTSYTVHKGSKQSVWVNTICGEEAIYGKE